MKQMLFGFSLLVSLNCFAEEVQNSCSATLFNLNDWSELSSSATICLNSKPDFITGVANLCSADGAQISPEFSEYLKYKKEYEETLAWYQALPANQQGAVAKNKVRQAKEAWENLGQKNKIGTLVYKAQLAYSNCVTQ